MSCALQRVCARANIGTSNSGVPTYRIRSRQLFRIHKLRFGTVSGATGAVCGDVNAVTCCMNLSGKSSLHRYRWQNQCPLSQQPVDTPMLGTCRTLSICSPDSVDTAERCLVLHAANWHPIKNRVYSEGGNCC